MQHMAALSLNARWCRMRKRLDVVLIIAGAISIVAAAARPFGLIQNRGLTAAAKQQIHRTLYKEYGRGERLGVRSNTVTVLPPRAFSATTAPVQSLDFFSQHSCSADAVVTGIPMSKT